MNYGNPYQYPPIPQQPPENTGKDILKVVGLQLGIFAGYQVLLALFFMATDQSGFLILDMFPLVLHWLVLLILMIVSFASQRKGRGLGYLISLLFCMIVGFGSCWGISSIVDKHGLF